MVHAGESLLLGPDAVEKVTGDRPSYSNFFRWTQSGLQTRDGRRVRLDFVKCGSKRKTSVEAVRRFLSLLTADAADSSSCPPAPREAAEVS